MAQALRANAQALEKSRVLGAAVEAHVWQGHRGRVLLVGALLAAIGERLHHVGLFPALDANPVNHQFILGCESNRVEANRGLSAFADQIEPAKSHGGIDSSKSSYRMAPAGGPVPIRTNCTGWVPLCELALLM
ncbi:hypothetical protein SBA4_1140003 [Candidatus Sulfopaludibacter sp. SbA4]|nr:hypothetical protein SBA4_1140003 [Candidatus Sulfopaludibacter sp. SbA4]